MPSFTGFRSPLLSFIAAVTLALPAAVQGHPGNAPGLWVPRPSSDLRQALVRYRDWTSRAAGQRDLARSSTGRAVPCAANPEVQVLSSAGTLSIDFTAGTVDLSNTLMLEVQTDGLSTIFVLMEELTGGVTTVSDGLGPLAIQDQGYGTFAITLRTPLSAGDTVTLTVQRNGTPQCVMDFYNVIFCDIQPDMAFTVGMAWQPMVLDLFTNDLLYPVQATLELTVPGGYTVASTGITLSDVDVGGGQHVVTLSNDFDGVFAFGIAPYAEGSATFGVDKQARTYLFSAVALPAAQTWRDETANVMNHHVGRFGPYPPDKVDLVEISDATDAATANYTAIFMPTGYLSFDPADWYATLVLAHELSHQWFGLLLRTDYWLSPWLDEGFAMFAETDYADLKGQKLSIPDLGALLRLQQRQQVIYLVPAQLDVPISGQEILEAPDEVFFTLTYSKGAMVVNMLRYLLGGDTPFFAAIHSYVAEHMDQIATVDTLRQSLEQVSGMDLSPFFDRWVHDKGFPTYTVRIVRGEASFKASIEITADQDFALPLPIQVDYADGSSELQRLPLEAPNTTFDLDLTSDREVLGVQLDPERQLLARFRGALTGDIHLNGEVDGIDLLYAALAHGQDFKVMNQQMETFHDWADLQPDGRIDDRDLDMVLGSFGAKEGE